MISHVTCKSLIIINSKRNMSEVTATQDEICWTIYAEWESCVKIIIILQSVGSFIFYYYSYSYDRYSYHIDIIIITSYISIRIHNEPAKDRESIHKCSILLHLGTHNVDETQTHLIHVFQHRMVKLTSNWCLIAYQQNHNNHNVYRYTVHDCWHFFA